MSFDQKKSAPREVLKNLEQENSTISKIIANSAKYLSYAKIFGVDDEIATIIQRSSFNMRRTTSNMSGMSSIGNALAAVKLMAVNEVDSAMSQSSAPRRPRLESDRTPSTSKRPFLPRKKIEASMGDLQSNYDHLVRC